MKPQTPQPKWWALFLILPLYIFLAVFITRLGLTGAGLYIAQFGSIVLIFYLTRQWIVYNTVAMAASDSQLRARDLPKSKPATDRLAEIRDLHILNRVRRPLLATFTVLGATLLMWLIGRDLLGEGVIALLYLAPIGWLTVRWGRISGASAALTAALCFDFFFIRPYFTFRIGNLEGWLLLILFMVISIVVVGRVMTLFSEARERQHEHDFLQELVALLANLTNREEIGRVIQNKLLAHYKAGSIKVIFYSRNGQPSVLLVKNGNTSPANIELPERSLPIYSDAELIGKITISQPAVPLPADDDPLLQSICHLVALALSRAQSLPDRKNSTSQALQSSQAE